MKYVKKTLRADPYKRALAQILYYTMKELEFKDKEVRTMALLWLASTKDRKDCITSEFVLKMLDIPRDVLDKYVLEEYGYDLKKVREEVSVLVKRYENWGILFSYLERFKLKKWKVRKVKRKDRKVVWDKI